MRIFSFLIVLLGALGDIVPARADNTTTAAEIDQAARAYLNLFVSSQERRDRVVDYTLGGLDPRLQLAECDDALSFEFVSEPEKSIRNTLLVSCTGDRPWRLFLNVEIEISSDAYVAATPLSRGTRITEAMLRQEKVVINQSRAGVYHDLEGLVGMETRRPVRKERCCPPRY
jgi:flagella basal body P-ring formation protein FlgA